ncbi:hypothetical protein HYPSUDRAFT_526014 [Hypholoma sublateritium FD-334 SS-4]|uniref:Uncharacterized protein n=1 Tax=Hypholoma sublateritium (strain FD-334 SS-4) TaxID=945553 RepID=A0A0D2LAV0_HYPSF|nr:hypothetical protein HYPSUDRAFT_526014 [Hypholoma sublateritium FD-334 SS-4]
MVSTISEATFYDSTWGSTSCDLDVREVLCETCSGLKQIVSEIPPSASSFNLSEKRRTLRTKVNYRHDPLHRLPFEIVSQIFISYLDESESSDKIFSHESVDPSTRNSPLLLASVCHTWRAAAFSTPQLWARIHVYLSGFSTIPARTNIAKQWLCRTGQLPLDISLTFADTYPSNAVAPLLDLLREHAPRWRQLTLRIAATHCSTLVDGLAVLPLLTAIRVHPPAASIWAAQEPLAVGHTPVLRHIAVANLALARVLIAYARLTSLEAADVFLADIARVLRDAPHLVCCRFARISGSIGVDGHPATLLVHSALRELSLQPDGEVAAPLGNFLALFVLPCLARLECDLTGSRDSLPVDGLCVLLTRPHCALTHFTVRVTEPDTRMTDEDLMRVLQATPTLTHLVIFTRCAKPVLSDALLARLATSLVGSREDPFLPGLEALEFYGKRTFSWSGVAQLFHQVADQDISRKLTFRPITEVHIQLSYCPSDPLELLPEYVCEQFRYATNAGASVDVIDSDGQDMVVACELR